LKPEGAGNVKNTPLKKQSSLNISGNLTPREGNGTFKPKMAQPVVLVNDQSPKSNKAGVTPKGTALDSLLSQFKNQLNNSNNGANTPNYRDRFNSVASASGIITPHSTIGNQQQQLNLSQITQLLKNA
jgi:hypothetical protein